jgi:type I restriction enzyme R subunit
LDAFLKHWNAAERKRAIIAELQTQGVIWDELENKVGKELAALLDKYVEQGVESLEDMDALKVEPINQLGSPRQIMQAFGGRAKYDEALQVLEQQLYS